jgi:hypothetical protein
MRNITVSISDAQFHQARIWTAERDTSLSATVEYLLKNLPKVVIAVDALVESELAAMGLPLPSIKSPHRLQQRVQLGKKQRVSSPKNSETKMQHKPNHRLATQNSTASQES